jgi:hypothetical protein
MTAPIPRCYYLVAGWIGGISAPGLPIIIWSRGCRADCSCAEADAYARPHIATATIDAIIAAATGASGIIASTMDPPGAIGTAVKASRSDAAGVEAPGTPPTTSCGSVDRNTSDAENGCRGD